MPIFAYLFRTFQFLNPSFSLLFVAFSLRVIAIFAVGDRSLEHEFAIIPRHILAGNGYAYFCETTPDHVLEGYLPNCKPLPSAFMPPMYPFFVTFWVGFFGEEMGVWWILFCQALLGVSVVWLLATLPHAAFSQQQKYMAAWVYALHPLAIVGVTQISAVTLYVWLNFAALWWLFRFFEMSKPFHLSISGVFYGLLLLARSESLLLLPLLALWMYRSNVSLRRVALWALPILCFGGAWSLRNHAVLGSFTLNTSGGFNLWIGQNPDFLGTHFSYTPSKLHPFSPELSRKSFALPHNARYEISRDSLFRTEAVLRIQRDPLDACLRAFRKFSFYWGHLWDLRISYPHSRSWALLVSWYPLLVLFVIGLWKSRRNKQHFMVFYLYFAVSTLVAMTFFVLPRYLLFLLPLICLVATFVFPSNKPLNIAMVT